MLNKRLRSLRNQEGLSQKEFAAKIHTTRDTYAQYEIGRRSPGYDTLVRIADYYKVTLDYLVGRTDNPNETKINWEGLTAGGEEENLDYIVRHHLKKIGIPEKEKEKLIKDLKQSLFNGDKEEFTTKLNVLKAMTQKKEDT